jgi:hypothetical protein
MTSPRCMPIFDGHNDVLLRLYRRGGTDAPRAFLLCFKTKQSDRRPRFNVPDAHAAVKSP